MSNLAPIVLFVYKRLEHTKKTIEALLDNPQAKDSILYIYSDGYKGVEDQKEVLLVRSYLETIVGFKEVVIKEAQENKGLANSVIEGVSEVLSTYDSAIILEDDLIVAKSFLAYMNEALVLYKDKKKVFGITGFTENMKIAETLPECFFLPITSSWTWATWNDRWSCFDSEATGWEQLRKNRSLRRKFDFGGTIRNSRTLEHQRKGLNNSWWIRWAWVVFKQQGLYLTPRNSLCQNVGFDGTGTNCGYDKNRIQETVASETIMTYPETVQLQRDIVRKVWLHYLKRTIGHKTDRIGYYMRRPSSGLLKLYHRGVSLVNKSESFARLKVQKYIEAKNQKKERVAGNWIYMFHSVKDGVNDVCGAEYTISVHAFEYFIKSIPQTMLGHIEELEDRTIQGKAFITFDDGYEDVFINAYPILKKYEIPFCVFFIVDCIGQKGYMNKEQLEELSQDPLCTVASHTLTHKNLRMLTGRESKKEICEGKQLLESLINREVRYLAYPYGSLCEVGKREWKYARQSGFALAFSTIQSQFYEDDLKWKFYIPRYNINNDNYLKHIEQIKYD